jgi:acetyl-CoA acyltransferase
MAILNEVVVIDAVRSPIGKSGLDGMKKEGQLCKASAQDLMASTIRGLLDRVGDKSPKFKENEIEEVIVGCISQVGEQGCNIARISSLLAGVPASASAYTVNQFGNTGLKSINIGVRTLRAGDGDIMLCAGVEIMSHYGIGSDMMAAIEAGYPVYLSKRFGETGINEHQGTCAEMIAEKEGLTREDLDRFAMWSMQKAVNAERKGWFAGHIVPFELSHESETGIVDKDETFRSKAADDPKGYMQDLSALKAPFKEDGIVTAGNSSQISDGAAAVLLMTADKAESLGLEPICRITGCASAGGDVTSMLLGPIPAAEKALARAGKKIEDMDIIEASEAFASSCLAYANAFGYAYNDPRVNPTGGCISLGHPTGASGTIYFCEMVHHLRRTNAGAGLQMVCGGAGLGIATVIEAV